MEVRRGRRCGEVFLTWVVVVRSVREEIGGGGVGVLFVLLVLGEV